MAPNIVDPPIQPESDNIDNIDRQKTAPGLPVFTRSPENLSLKIFRSSLNLLAHILIGAVVGVSLMFAFRYEMPLAATPLHIVLCVLGYQLLMAEAILSLSSENGWTSYLKLVDKRRAHWILQIVGSVLAIVGSFIKIVDKTVHWNSFHGQFGLVALVFTTVSLVNGTSSLWAYELRRFLPGNISKLTHICFGSVAFAAAGITLCFGFEKAMFKNWASEELANTFIGLTALLTFIVIITPMLTFFTKLKVIKKL